MGTINYGTSDYITMGIKPMSAYELVNDPDFIEGLREMASENNLDFDSLDIYQEAEGYITECYKCDYENIKTIRDKYSLYYYHIVIREGYYDGFYLDIEDNFGICYDNYQDKREAQKEVTEIKEMLTEMAGCGLVQVYPGWCTGYEDYNGTIKGIKEAVKEMRADIRSTPTWRQYEKESA